MSKSSAPVFLRDLKMPLRDALRGAATLADATEDMLEPAAQLFPEPMRTRFRHALQSLEQVGRRLTEAPIGTAQIAAAARFLSGRQVDSAASDACASVLVYAWDHLHEASVTHRHMISEIIVAERMSRIARARPAHADDTAFAATVLTNIRRSSAIGLIPGWSRSIPADEETEIDLALLTIGVWLLTGRADTMTEEETLLDLSMALVRAMENEAASVFDDDARLARFLGDTAAHL